MIDFSLTGPLIDLPTLTLSFARGELGVEEVPRGSNGGTKIAEYLRTVHQLPPASWCAAFACW